MGQVNVEVFLENAVDREMAKRGFMNKADVRNLTTKAVVDSGVMMMTLPQGLVEKLGLDILSEVERQRAGPVRVVIGKRETTLDCLVGPPASGVLLGQVMLTAMGLQVDDKQHVLVPPPESPSLPIIKIRRMPNGSLRNHSSRFA